MIQNPEGDALVQQVKNSVRDLPGIYRFFGEGNRAGEERRIIYIGKSITLRRRMLDHLRQIKENDHHRHARMVFEIREFDFEYTETELLALLGEDRLIKIHRPAYNKRQIENLNQRYLVLTDDEYPALRMVDDASRGSWRGVFGPYLDKYYAEKLLQIASRYSSLRTCPDSTPNQKCLRFELDNCLAPCRGRVDPAAYESAVQRTIAWLALGDQSLLEVIEQTMKRHGEALEYEQAAGVKEQLDFSARFCRRQLFLHDFQSGRMTIHHQDDRSYRYHFNQGRLESCSMDTTSTSQTSGRGLTTICEELGLHLPVDNPGFLQDRGHLVYSWLCKNSSECEVS